MTGNIRMVVTDDNALVRAGLVTLFRVVPTFEVVGERPTAWKPCH